MNLDSNKIVAYRAQHKCRATKCVNYDRFLINESINTRGNNFFGRKIMQSNLVAKNFVSGQENQMADFLIPRKTVEKLSGLSRATIYRLIKAGKFPRPLSIGTGAVRWRQSDIVAWQQSLPATSEA